MKLTIDTVSRSITREENGQSSSLSLYTKEAFEMISQIWLKVGWNQKYPYTFTWLGRPVIQAPEDMLRIQEVIFRVKPEIIVETGVAHGGSLIFYASLLRAMGIAGRIVGVDIEIRPDNRKAIENHLLATDITLIEGSSIAADTVARVKAQVPAGKKVLVLLDSCHTKDHVFQELEAYHELVTVGSYIVATDGSMKDLYDVPRGKPDWVWNNPAAAAEVFAGKHPEFVLEQPDWLFNESDLTQNITHWPHAFLRRAR